MSNSESAKAQQRILLAATELFSRMGYNGVSTRYIARVADVNETSIYRYYPRKRDLFVATIESEFSKVQLRVDQLSKLGSAQDGRAAMLVLFQLILEAMLDQRPLIRLMHFSVLEFGSDLDDLYRRHFRDALRIASEYLSRWPELIETHGFDTRVTVVAFIATIVILQDFYPVLAGHTLTEESLQQAAQTCAGLWYRALADEQPRRIPVVSTSAHA